MTVQAHSFHLSKSVKLPTLVGEGEAEGVDSFLRLVVVGVEPLAIPMLEVAVSTQTPFAVLQLLQRKGCTLSPVCL
jgi:hypothetical protein